VGGWGWENLGFPAVSLGWVPGATSASSALVGDTTLPGLGPRRAPRGRWGDREETAASWPSRTAATAARGLGLDRGRRGAGFMQMRAMEGRPRWDGPAPRAPALTSNKKSPRLTPAYIRASAPPAADRAHSPRRGRATPRAATMTSSKIEMPGEVKADPAALMASLHLLPSPTPNLEIKYTKVSGHGAFQNLPSLRLWGQGRPVTPAPRGASCASPRCRRFESRRGVSGHLGDAVNGPDGGRSRVPSVPVPMAARRTSESPRCPPVSPDGPPSLDRLGPRDRFR
jgi:hypothetical protein